MNADCFFELKLNASVDVSQALGPFKSGFYKSKELVETVMACSLAGSVDEETTGALTISMNAHHAENAKTKRRFHTSIRAQLDPIHVRELRDFLNFILTE